MDLLRVLHRSHTVAAAVSCLVCVFVKVSRLVGQRPLEYIRRKAWTADPVRFSNGISAVTSLCLLDQPSAGGEFGAVNYGLLFLIPAARAALGGASFLLIARIIVQHYTWYNSKQAGPWKMQYLS